MLRTLIIDDEAHIRNTLSRLLVKYCPKVEITGGADDVISGISAIRSLHPDLVFLDIHLPDGNAFDLLNAFDTIDFKLVFISSFDSKSIQVFKSSGLIYLQKPFNPFELKEVVEKALSPDTKDLQQHIKVLEHDFKNAF